VQRWLAAAILVAGLIASWTLAEITYAGPPAPSVPGRIAVDDGNKVFLVGHASGVQIYTCNGTAWSAATPRAELRDDAGKVIITHYGGPTWEARDGSKVVGQRVDGVTVDPTAIPWLKLKAASTSAGPDGSRLTATTFIQRVNTTGGLVPPAGTCNAGTAGTVAEIPYTADYYFWKRTG
jgi:hypothetical protein